MKKQAFLKTQTDSQLKRRMEVITTILAYQNNTSLDIEAQMIADELVDRQITKQEKMYYPEGLE